MAKHGPPNTPFVTGPQTCIYWIRCLTWEIPCNYEWQKVLDKPERELRSLFGGSQPVWLCLHWIWWPLSICTDGCYIETGVDDCLQIHFPPPCLPPSNPAVSTLVPNLTTSDIYINNKNRNTKNWQVRQVLQSAISIVLFLKKMLRLVQICPKYCTLKELMIAVNVLSVHTGHEAQH